MVLSVAVTSTLRTSADAAALAATGYGAFPDETPSRRESRHPSVGACAQFLEMGIQSCWCAASSSACCSAGIGGSSEFSPSKLCDPSPSMAASARGDVLRALSLAWVSPVWPERDWGLRDEDIFHEVDHGVGEVSVAVPRCWSRRRAGDRHARTLIEPPGITLDSARFGDDNGRVTLESRVLVAEDEDNIRYVCVGALRNAGFEVSETTSGREVLRLVGDAETMPDLLVLDVMFPDLDGFEVCRRMRTDRVDVPVIFLTARDATEDRVTGLTIGGDDYLTKPFSVEELTARVVAVLRRAGKGRHVDVLSAGNVEVDDDARVVRKAGVEVAVSPTEYKLLRYLMRNAGRAMSRGQILDHVWNYDFDGESTVVETFVSSLRKKIESDGERLIHTVRGHGYRLEAD